MKDFKMLSYKIVHHIPGRIRIEVPYIKSIPISVLLKISKQFSSTSLPDGIEEIRPNPYSGSIIIKYKPDKIDIIQYLKDFSSNIEMQKLLSNEKRSINDIDQAISHERKSYVAD